MSSPPRPLRPAVEPTGGPLLSIPQLVTLLAEHGMQVSERQAYRYLDAGIIPSHRPTGDRGAYVLHRAEILDWIANGDTNRRRESAPALTAEVIADAVAQGIKRALRGVG